METKQTIPDKREDVIRQGREETRKVLDEAEAKHKKSIEKMAVYRPVNPRVKKKDDPPR